MAAQCSIRASLHHRISALAFVSEHLSCVTWQPSNYLYPFMLIFRSGQFDIIQHKASPAENKWRHLSFCNKPSQ